MHPRQARAQRLRKVEVAGAPIIASGLVPSPAYTPAKENLCSSIPSRKGGSMQIRIEGSRASSHNRQVAYHAPASALPVLSEADKAAAGRLGLTPDAYARLRYASDLEDVELAARAESIAELVKKWLHYFAPAWTITEALFQTIEGKLHLTLTAKDGRCRTLLLSEDLVDELLNSGSSAAAESLERLLHVNLNVPTHARAS